MFFHNFKYALYTLFKNKMLIFWTFAFPIILGTFFQMAFSDIEKSEQLDIIPIAIVETESFQNNSVFQESFRALSDETKEERLFDTQYVSLNRAKELLDDGEIDGYLLFEEEPKVVVVSSGIEATVLKYVTEEVWQTEKIFQNIFEKKLQGQVGAGSETPDMTFIYQNIYQDVLTMLEDDVSFIRDTSREHLSYTMIEFYTLIAMACLYGGILGMVAINKNLANMSNHGKRTSVSPLSKWTLVGSSVLASYIVQLIGVFLLFLYTIFVLQVDYGNHLFFTILLALVGSLAGLSMGIFVATVFKKDENFKTGIIISITMLGCFFSGMMGITMKYIIDKNIPILNKLNPANMITDGFYSLYYYDTFDRFYLNLLSLLIFSMILIGVAWFSLRRQKYDSI